MEYNIILEVVHWMYNLDNNNTNTDNNNNKLNNITITNKMKRTLESDTRLRYLLGNNPMGELIRITHRACIKSNEIKRRKVSTHMGERNQ
jgi:hypothetical protein